MVCCFWAEAAARRYLPDAALRGEVSEFLLAYLGSGLRDQSTAFAPTGGGGGSGGGGGGASRLFYLWGLPGIGKTTFATVFAASLEAVLQRFVDPERRCRIVKVPLNAVTPANLRAVLRVKGISDWSIERVLEQTIVRGDLALFHLEENPAEHGLQLALHALIAKMLAAITRLYPDSAAGCILHLCTSNYAPAEALARGARVVEMSPPGPERQRSWCEAELAVHLSSALGEAAAAAAAAGGTAAPPPLDVQVTLAPAVMPQTSDLRALKKLVYTVAFAAAQHAVPAAPAAAAAAAAPLPASVLRLSLGPDPDVGVDKGAEGASSAAAGEGEGVCGMVADMRWDPPAGDAAAPLAPLRLVSSDGFFFHPRRAGGGEAATAAVAGGGATGEAVLREAGWAQAPRATACSLLAMVDAGFLAPAVVCLAGGTAAARDRYCVALGAAMRARYGAAGLHVEELAAREEGDKALIVGEKHELNGGLFQVIDRAARHPGGVQTVLVVARVNAVGQFLLRELIEDGDSRTHRQAVSLRRVLFVLSVDEGCEVAAQTRSRAHDVVDCTEF